MAKEDGPDGMPVVEDADHPMTMRELMSHTAGLTYGLFSRSQVDTLYQKAGIIVDPTLTVKEMVGRLPRSRCASSRARCGTTASRWTCRATCWRFWAASRSMTC